VLVGVTCLIASFLPLTAQAAQAPMGPGDWRYDSLDRLSQSGLLAGHPRGPLSQSATSLTRYEAAALTLRAVEAMGQAYQAQGKSLVQVAQATDEKVLPPIDEPEAEGQTEEAPSAEITAGLTSENLALVQKLIEEFRTELVTMGARVDYLETGMKDVQSRLAKVESDQKKHAIDGYMQLRYRDDNASSGRREFQVRRVRINLRGPVSEKVSYRVEMQFDSKTTDGGPGSKAQLRTAYVDYKISPASRFRMGQAILPWGYELEESVPNLWTGERSLWMDRLFPDQRDIGAFFNYRRKPSSPMFDISVVNGTNINAVDNNNKSNLLARVDFPLKNGSIALSGYTGTNGDSASRTRQDRDGVSARYSFGTTQFLGEFVTGNDKGKDMQGWYAQLGHPVGSAKPNLLFVKYDRYDENRDAPDDLFRRWSFGYWYQLDPATRLTFVHELRSVGPAFSELNKWNGNATYLQLQVKF
jgi:hypothetical protein